MLKLRDCKDCNLCCKLPEIPSINKKSYTWCKDCNIGVGCSIYKNRPKKCKEFFCAWKIGLLPENLKPNKVGFFAFLENELSPIEKVLTVYCEQYKLNNIVKFLKNVNITDKLGQAYRFVIRYFYIVGSSEDIKNANRLLNAHNTINKKDHISYSILNYEPPLILKKDVA